MEMEMEMEVKIIQTDHILPSSPPFSDTHILSLSHLDTDPNQNLTFRYIRVYSAAAAHQPFRLIAAALSSALVHFYPLAATLRRRDSDHRLELLCSKGQSVPLVRAAANCTLHSLAHLDHPDPGFVNRLVPDPDSESGMANPCQLQVTEFECGGYVLGTALHHSLCDGLGATVFFSAVAELARGSDRMSVEPVWDRAGLLGPREPPRIEAPIGEVLGLEKGWVPYKEEVGTVVTEFFPVKEEHVERLKKLMLAESGWSFTTFEALGAFIWRAKVRASNIPGEKMVKFAYAMNIRRLVKPPIPGGYWGNGCVPMYAQLTAEDLAERPISQTAELIKKSKINANNDYIRSYIDFQELHYADGITAGSCVSGFTDWRHLGHSSIDFGSGGPVTVLPVSTNILGSMEPCFFLPYSSANANDKKDGFKVLVNLRETAMPAFREEMERFSAPEFDLS